MSPNEGATSESVCRLVGVRDLLAEARELAVGIVTGVPVATRLAKSMTRIDTQMDLPGSAEADAAAESTLLSSEDGLEGLSAPCARLRPEVRGH
jgi:hypothetical protein